MAGWDMVIFEGKSPKPVYLHDQRRQGRDARCLADSGASDLEDRGVRSRSAHQDPHDARLRHRRRRREPGAFTPAIVNDLHRAAGRSGVGAVMGSKNLKAIARARHQGRGQRRATGKAFMQRRSTEKKVLRRNAVTGQGLPTFGTQVLMNVINEIGALPTRNHRDVQFEGAKDISAEAMATPRKTDGKKNLVTNQACFGCTIACGRISKIDETHFTVRNKPRVLGRLRRSRVRSGLGARRRQRRQRPRSAARTPTSSATSMASTRSRSAPPSAP